MKSISTETPNGSFIAMLLQLQRHQEVCYAHVPSHGFMQTVFRTVILVSQIERIIKNHTNFGSWSKYYIMMAKIVQNKSVLDESTNKYRSAVVTLPVYKLNCVLIGSS